MIEIGNQVINLDAYKQEYQEKAEKEIDYQVVAAEIMELMGIWNQETNNKLIIN